MTWQLKVNHSHRVLNANDAAVWISELECVSKQTEYEEMFSPPTFLFLNKTFDD